MYSICVKQNKNVSDMLIEFVSIKYKSDSSYAEKRYFRVNP